MDKQLLDILVCPVSGMSVSPADAGQIKALNAKIEQGNLLHVDGSAVAHRLDGLLVTRDRTTGYRVDDGIPVMLPERGIELPDEAS